MNKPIYRIIHLDNLDFIFQNGKITCPSHQETDPDYKGIGLNDLIIKRSQKKLKAGSSQTFLDYVAFYLGARSPMLYKIKTGNGVPQINQSQIIYFISDTDTVVAAKLDFLFTDGHATAAFSKFFTDIADLKNIDWTAVNARYWTDDPNSDTDFDRQRKKQAEFLVEREIPLSCIQRIATFDKTAKTIVETKLQNFNLTIPVVVNKSLYYV